MWDPQFLDLMPHTVTLTAPTGRNAQGRPTFTNGVAKTYRARIVGDILALRDSTKGVESQAFIVYAYMGTDPVNTDYRLALPSDPAWDAGTPFMYAVERFADESGHHHVKIICGFTFHHQTKL